MSLVAVLLLGVVNTAFIGHLGDENQVAGAGMAIMLINQLCFSVMLGLSSAMSTLVS